MNTQPRMYYFGPWDRPGHYCYDENGSSVRWNIEDTLPWLSKDNWVADGGLQPIGDLKYKNGAALLHKKDGWTALAFWDNSVDRRRACVSVYLAEGDFTFEQMVEMAKARFAVRWNRMDFEVRPGK